MLVCPCLTLQASRDTLKVIGETVRKLTAVFQDYLQHHKGWQDVTFWLGTVLGTFWILRRIYLLKILYGLEP